MTSYLPDSLGMSQISTLTDLRISLTLRCSQAKVFLKIYLTFFNTKTWEQCKLVEIYSFKYGEFNNNPDNGGQYPIYGANGIIGDYDRFNAENSIIIGHMGEYAGSVIYEKKSILLPIMGQ